MSERLVAYHEYAIKYYADEMTYADETAQMQFYLGHHFGSYTLFVNIMDDGRMEKLMIALFLSLFIFRTVSP